jgi:hypothetical protein
MTQSESDPIRPIDNLYRCLLKDPEFNIHSLTLHLKISKKKNLSLVNVIFSSRF